MKNVEIISLDLSEFEEIWFIGVVFAEMKKKIAKDHHSLVRKEYKIFLPEGLNFDSENLVAINLKGSSIKKLWKGKKVQPLLSLLFLY